MRRVITPHILVVDDDPLLLTSLRDILESNGHSIVTADGGWKGIDEYFAVRQRGQTFDVVISGLGMPKIDGRAVAVAIRSAERPCRSFCSPASYSTWIGS